MKLPVYILTHPRLCSVSSRIYCLLLSLSVCIYTCGFGKKDNLYNYHNKRYWAVRNFTPKLIIQAFTSIVFVNLIEKMSSTWEGIYIPFMSHPILCKPLNNEIHICLDHKRVLCLCVPWEYSSFMYLTSTSLMNVWERYCVENVCIVPRVSLKLYVWGWKW